MLVQEWRISKGLWWSKFHVALIQWWKNSNHSIETITALLSLANVNRSFLMAPWRSKAIETIFWGSSLMTTVVREAVRVLFSPIARTSLKRCSVLRDLSVHHSLGHQSINKIKLRKALTTILASKVASRATIKNLTCSLRDSDHLLYLRRKVHRYRYHRIRKPY